VGGAFRHHDLAVAHRGLADLLTGLQALMGLTVAIAQASGAVGPAPQDAFERLQVALESLATTCEQQDWAGAADVLEQQVAAVLPEWQIVLKPFAEMGSPS
jgi:hypothetical protein